MSSFDRAAARVADRWVASAAAAPPFDWSEAEWGASVLAANGMALAGALRRGQVQRFEESFGRLVKELKNLGRAQGWDASGLDVAQVELLLALRNVPLLPRISTSLEHPLGLLEEETRPGNRNPRIYLANVAALVTGVRVALQQALAQGMTGPVATALRKTEEEIIRARDRYPRATQESGQ